MMQAARPAAAMLAAFVALLAAMQGGSGPETYAFLTDQASVGDNKFTARIPDAREPREVEGNPSCRDLNASWSELRIEDDIGNGKYRRGNFEVTLSNVTERLFDWSANAGVDAVIAKGGPNALVYDYDPEATADQRLHPPVNPSNGQYYGISHIGFCYDG